MARRLLPVITFATGLCLGVAVAGQSALAVTGTLPAGHRHTAALTSPASISSHVGAIPGASQPAPGRGPSGSGPVPSGAVLTGQLPSAATSRPAKLTRLLQADVLLVAQKSLPAGLVSRLRQVGGVVAAVPVDAGRVKVNGVFVNVLGVDPTAFRPFAAGPTARSASLWQNVAAGGMAVSYTMGHQDRLTLSKP
ncbi:MAG TPA: hypothetical protein VFW16_15860, partial [Streptosporangiaceae bacterium]|nr:hypothetical protein [Streptosporangiaceae bacterium]